MLTSRIFQRATVYYDLSQEWQSMATPGGSRQSASPATAQIPTTVQSTEHVSVSQPATPMTSTVSSGVASSSATPLPSSGEAKPAPGAAASSPATQASGTEPARVPKRKRCSVKNGLKDHPSVKRLRKELIAIVDDPPPNCNAQIAGVSLAEWTATICGPAGSPYEGGTFHLRVQFPLEYPFCPPKVTFKTKIYHCNISRNGDICLDILKDKWSVALTTSTVLLSISSLLTDANPDDPLESDIAERYLKSRAEHDRIASEWTKKYAM